MMLYIGWSFQNITVNWISRRIKEMEAIINFLKNGVAITFYGVLFIFGVFTLYGIFKGIVRKILKMMFTEED